MVAIVDYGVGNIASVEKAIRASGADAVVTDEKSTLLAAEKIVLPGVGAFGDCMRCLTESGLIPPLREKIASGTQLLGICVGLQILFDGSDESPGVPGLGLIPGRVRRIEAPGLKIPHMGWNSLQMREPRDYIFAGLSDSPYFYFVHSYHAVPDDGDAVMATAEYGERLTAAVRAKNILATQFHPEKSGDVGLIVLKNFLGTAVPTGGEGE